MGDSIRTLEATIARLKEMQQIDPSRDVAVAITNLETGVLWLRKASV
jgi:hypothetical protein